MTSSKQPILAIVVPIYGHPSLLIDALESALRQQTVHEYRIVLVNDGCPSPQSDQVCRQYARTHPERILYVKKRNGGLSSARNRGIKVALDAWPSVRAIYLLDADNRLQPHLLERAYALLEADPAAGWIFPDVHMFGSSREFCDTTGDFTRLQLLADNFCEAGSLVRREVFEAGVWYDGSMKLGYEDWEFWLQAVAAGFKGKHGPALGFHYRKRAESMLANSHRDQHQITGYLRRKHAQLFTPRAAQVFEREELPRFALYLADRDELILTSDVRDHSRRQTWTAFARALRRHESQPRLQAVPPTLVVTSAATLELLLERGIAANVLWLLEADLEDRQLFFLQVEQRMGVEVRLDISPTFSPDVAARHNSVLCALPTALLEKCLRDPDTRSLESIIEAVDSPRASGRRLLIEHLERPHPLAGASARRLCETVRRLHAEYRTQPRSPVNRRRRFYRAPLDAGHLSRQVFQTAAPPPLSSAAGERHLGFVVSLAERSDVAQVVCNVARETQRQGWRVHLFVVGAGHACLAAEFRDVFDSIHLLPDEPLTRPERLVSLLGTMHVVVNYHTLPLYAALGALKRLGVKLIDYLHHVEFSPTGLPCGPPYRAADYEHSLHKVAVASRSLQTFILAKAVPAEKLIHAPDAPGFEIAPERVDAALAERALRGAEEPLRVLVLAHFDQEYALAPLVDLIRQSECQTPAVTWRLVGCAGAAQSLEKYHHPPAIDAFAQSRHYCWADVLLDLSGKNEAPLSILNAQQFGCVPIALNGGELIEDGATGFLLEEPTTAQQALELFTTLQHDRARLLDMANCAALVRRTETWRDTLRDLLDCLDGWFPKEGAS